MRRLISDAVEVRPAPKLLDLSGAVSLEELAAQPELGGLRSQLPTDAEVREALGKLTAKLEADVAPYLANGWTVQDFNPTEAFTLHSLDDASIAMRGSIIIARPD